MTDHLRVLIPTTTASCDGLRAMLAAVILLDLRKPDVDDATATDRIRSHDLRARILVLTTHDPIETSTAPLTPAQPAICSKDPVHQLFVAIRFAARGEANLSPTIATRVRNWMLAPSPGMLSGRNLEVPTAVAYELSNGTPLYP
ncbi:MAG TPA: hypothetical protein VGX25_08715 [Actinophytocola sp.]|uniref:hypothetical protein n=1 Tax=Actinophytocola sp. TaxID=1872138 RepID=UPI002DDD6148|nr:hypothetical protein [Actinophytocola sp.]HEV2779470.1 hypothetical protein [Actinophytocola sp.]